LSDKHNGALYDMTIPLEMSDNDFKWFCEILDSKSNIRKEIINKEFELFKF